MIFEIVYVYFLYWMTVLMIKYPASCAAPIFMFCT